MNMKYVVTKSRTTIQLLYENLGPTMMIGCRVHIKSQSARALVLTFTCTQCDNEPHFTD